MSEPHPEFPGTGHTDFLPKTSGLAKASAILGLLGLLCSSLSFGGALGGLGLLLGIGALIVIRRSEGFLKGTGLAWCGIILCILAVALSAIYSRSLPAPANLEPAMEAESAPSR